MIGDIGRFRQRTEGARLRIGDQMVSTRDRIGAIRFPPFLHVVLLLAAGLSLGRCSEGDRIRVVPQVGPVHPVRVTFSPEDPHLLAVVEEAGAVSLWDVTDAAKPLEKLVLHTRAVDARILPGRTIVTGERDGTLKLWNFDGSLRDKPLHAHRGRVLAIDASPAGLVSAGEDGTVALWGLDGKPRVSAFRAHDGPVVAVAISLHGDIATAGRDRMVRRWNLQGVKVWESPFEGVLTSVAFSARGDLLAAGGAGVQLWRLGGPAESPRFQVGIGDVTAVAFSPQFDVLAVASRYSGVSLWNPDGSPHGSNSFGRSAALPGSQKEGIRALAFSPREGLLAMARSDGLAGSVQLWQLGGSLRGQVEVKPYIGPFDFDRPWDISAVSFSQRGLLAVSTLGGAVWLAPPGSTVEKPLRSQRTPVIAMVFSPHGDTLASGDGDGNLLICPVRGVPEDGPCTTLSQPDLKALAFVGRKDLLAIASRDGTIRFWRSDEKPERSPLQTGKEGIAIAGSPTRDLLAVVAERKLSLWDVSQPTGAHRVQEATLDSDTYTVAFSRDGDLLATGDNRGEVILWNPDGSRRGEMLKHGSYPVGALAFSPREDLLASLDSAHTIQLWNPDGSPRGKPLEMPMDTPGPMPALAFSPTEDLLAAGHGREIYLWNLNGSLRGPAIRNTAGVASIAAAPAKNLVAAVTAGDEIHLWDLAGKELSRPPMRHENVHELAFSPDGQRLTSSGRDGTVMLWRTDGTRIALEEQARTSEVFGGTDSVAFSPNSERLALAGRWEVLLWDSNGGRLLPKQYSN
ncbi:MAG TPA: hypothetical protein VGG20_07660, partial [Thermoanaerobaculia bacterium]